MSSSGGAKQPDQRDDASKKAQQSPAGGSSFTRKMTISKSGRFRESQGRRGSLFDEQGNSLFQGAPKAPAANTTPTPTPSPEEPKFFTMAF